MVTMAQLVTVLRVATVLNLLVLGGLVAVWGRSYWQYRASHTLSLLTFGGFLLVQNGFALFLFTVSVPFTNWMSVAEAQAMAGMVGLTLLQSIALLILARVTWQ